MKFSDKVYDRLKFLVLIGLPAIATFYLSFAQIWDFPEPEKVGTSIALLATLLGTLLQISNSRFQKEVDMGVVNVTGYDELTGHPNLQPVLRGEKLADLPNRGVITLKVNNQAGSPPPVVGEIEEH